MGVINEKRCKINNLKETIRLIKTDD